MAVQHIQISAFPRNVEAPFADTGLGGFVKPRADFGSSELVNPFNQILDARQNN